MNSVIPLSQIGNLPQLEANLKVETQVIDFAIATIKKMSEDSQRRLEGYQKNIKLLEKGIFYSNDYYLALKNINQKARLQWFIEKGHFYHDYASPKHFSRIPKPNSITSVEVGGFVSKNDTTPSLALEALKEGLTFIDCERFIKLAYYSAIKDLIGEKKFNKHFNSLVIGSSILKEQIKDYVKVHPLKDEQDIRMGDGVYLQNHHKYSFKHINGNDLGIWVMCIDDSSPKKFIGLGLDSKGMTLEEIKILLKDGYNKDPMDINFVTQHIGQRILSSYPQHIQLETQSLKDHQLETAEFLKQGGGQLLPLVFRIDVEKLKTLLD